MSTKGKVSLSTTNPRIAKFLNYVMKDGKRFLSLKLLANAFADIERRGHENPEEIFDRAIENIIPKIEVRPKRVGGSIYQVPQEVQPKRQFALASRWILGSARKRTGITFSVALAQELVEASQETGNAFKKKLDVYKQAEANKAFARFANPRS